MGYSLSHRGLDRVMDLQLPMHSVPITTNVMSSNLADSEVYSIQHYFISLSVTCGGFRREVLFPPPIKLTANI